MNENLWKQKNREIYYERVVVNSKLLQDTVSWSGVNYVWVSVELVSAFVFALRGLKEKGRDLGQVCGPN